MTMFSIVKLELDSKIKINNDIDETVDIAFYLTEKAAQNRIGVKFEGNINDSLMNRVNKHARNELFFELMDNPIVNFTEKLFMGEGYPHYKERMNRIQTFLQSIYDLKQIKKITLDIDAYPTEKQTIEDGVPVINLHPQEFKEVMFKLHEENYHDTPLVRLIMDKRLNDKLFVVNELDQKIN